MKKRALWKDIFREIRHTKARFISIFAIIMLGVSFFPASSQPVQICWIQPEPFTKRRD